MGCFSSMPEADYHCHHHHKPYYNHYLSVPPNSTNYKVVHLPTYTSVNINNPNIPNNYKPTIFIPPQPIPTAPPYLPPGPIYDQQTDQIYYQN
jgi:hypothetical protein